MRTVQFNPELALRSGGRMRYWYGIAKLAGELIEPIAELAAGADAAGSTPMHRSSST